MDNQLISAIMQENGVVPSTMVEDIIAKCVAQKRRTAIGLLQNSDILISRNNLLSLVPHRGCALVASYGQIQNSVFSLVLSQRHFGRYTKDHPWAFPGHWQTEMVAQMVGFEAMRQLQIDGFDTECLGSPFLKNPGVWTDKYLSVALESGVPIIAIPAANGVRYDIKIGFVFITGSAIIKQGLLSQKITGIKIVARINTKYKT